MKLSVCLIVKNESKSIDRILTCASKFADEIIVVDTGSTDNTVALAKKYTDKVYPFTWVHDFSAARNYSFSLAKGDYIMWLDADDYIDDLNIYKLLTLKNHLTYECYMLKYFYAFDEYDKPTLYFYRERIVKRSAKPVWVDAIHEYIEISGKRVHEDISIFHRKVKKTPSTRNINIYNRLVKNKVPFSPRMTYYYARELMFNKRYKKAIRYFKSLILKGEGFKENLIGACYDLCDCYKAVNLPYNAVDALLKSFNFDTPRAEIACKLGEYFLETNNYNAAIFWYEYALSKKADDKSGGFILRECYDIIPLLQLCVCYYKIGNTEKAIYYNDCAGKLFPTNESYIHNKEFFNKSKK